MDSAERVDRQVELENTYSIQSLRRDVEAELRDSAVVTAQVAYGLQLLEAWLLLEHFKSKKARLNQLDPMHLEDLVWDVYSTIAYHCVDEEPLVNVCGQMAVSMGFDSHKDSIRTVSEVVAVLCNSEAYDINKPSKYASLTIGSRMALSQPLMDRLQNKMFIPPMVSPPKEVTSNFESGYLTFNESLILGHNNSHAEDICLDSINSQNAITLSLDMEFIKQVVETPSKPHESIEDEQLWSQFLAQSNEVYKIIEDAGNQFWLNNAPDKRGRLYAVGYHVTTQGRPYKKAMIELAHKELLTGMPV